MAGWIACLLPSIAQEPGRDHHAPGRQRAGILPDQVANVFLGKSDALPAPQHCARLINLRGVKRESSSTNPWRTAIKPKSKPIGREMIFTGKGKPLLAPKAMQT